MEPFGLILGTERKDIGATRAIRSPYDGREVGRIQFGDAAAVSQAIELAAARFPSFSHEPLHRRIGWLRAIAEGIEAHAEKIAYTIADEAGKPIRFARGEVMRAPATFRAAADEAARLDGELLPLDKTPGGEGRLGLVRRVPLGPVAAITPFNFPLNLAAHKIASALAAGNTVIHKPASQTPLTAILLGRIALAAGLPEGVLSTIPCASKDAEPLITDPRVRVLSFTGSAEVGWRIKERAPKKKITLELGGNAGAIVEPDVDIVEAAQRLALGAFLYAGQVCISVQRIFVHRDVADRFIEAFTRSAREDIRCGDPRDESVICGPIIDEPNTTRLQSWFQEGSAGGRVLLDMRRDGNVLTPGVLADVPHQLAIVRQEAFGPVAVIEKYADYSAALASINDSPYGLQASIYTRDIGKLMQAFDTLEVGGIIHNDYPNFRADPMPYGGMKESGFGREGPRYAIETMTDLRLLVVRV